MIEFDVTTITPYLAAFAAGLLSGAAYFTALWLTLHKLPDSRRPGLRLILSLIARLGLMLMGCYIVLTVGNWVHLLAALAGFVSIRSLWLKRLGPAGNTSFPRSPPGLSS